jgi:transposase
MRNPFLLAGDQMMRLQLSYPKSRGKPREDGRRGLSGIIFIKGSSLRWSDIPVDYGPRKTLCKQWSNMGLFARIMTGPANEIPDRQTNSFDVT